MKKRNSKKANSSSEISLNKNISQILSWQGALKMIRGRVFKIKSPRGHGTGFHVGNYGNNLCAVATADHVVRSENDWGEPIKLTHDDTGEEILLKENERAIFSYPNSDLAIIVFNPSSNLILPSEEIDSLDSQHFLFPGVDIGWCGFPGIRSEKLCFFHGYISCHLEQEASYLVDGVAINGVSGGPVFFIDENNKPRIAGVISAYIPNRLTSDSLPGVSVVSLIPPEFEDMIKSLRNLPAASEEAKKIQEEQK